MKIHRSGGAGGAWLKKDELRNGDIIKLVSEASEIEGQNGPQLVAKCRVKGATGDAVNLALNSATRNGLIDAYGDDSKNWVDKMLTVEVEKVLIAGKRGTSLYLVPEGFSIETDAGGYVVITRDGGEPETKSAGEDTRKAPMVEPTDEINPEDIPF